MAGIPKAVRDYMSKIGARGGAAGKGTPARQAAARKAIATRWANHQKKAKP